MGLAPGSDIGGYRVVRQIGEGGMGAVYLVEHPRLPRHDALKILSRALSADPDFRARFDREADIAARLRHPHIVSVYDRGETRGQLWIAMQYVEGQDVSELVKATPGGLPVDRTLDIVFDVAKALDAAHHNGLLHRDVKPANMLLTPPADRYSREMTLLTDFGIARSTTADGARLTVPGSVVGTLAYSAPEQLAGDDVDHHADIYALGCSLYEMLTGDKPFQCTTIPTAIYAHLTEPPPCPSQVRTGLPRGIDSVIARAMAKDPRDRYNDCHALAADAARILRPPAARPVPPPPVFPTAPMQVPGRFPPPPPAPPPPPKSRRGLVVAAAVVVSALVAAGIGAAVWRSGSDADAGGPPTTTTAPPTTTVPAGRTASAVDSTFTVQLPDGWRSEKPDKLLTLLTADRSANILVSRNPRAKSGPTLHDSANISAQEIVTQLSGVIDSGGIESATVDGEPAVRLTYDIPPGGDIAIPARGRQLFVRHDGVEYLITFTGTAEAFNRTVAAYESIIDSWHWN